MSRTGGNVLVDQLARHGVRRVFCVPGESFLPVLDALHDSPIDLVVCRQEGGAAYMADAHGRLTGDPGVCLVTRGPGVAGAMVGLHTAWQEGTPLLLLVGLPRRMERYREAFQEFDVADIARATTKHVEVIDDAVRIPERVARAFATARSGRPGPVLLGLPEDMLGDEVEVPDATPIPVPEPAVRAEDLAALADRLAVARRPIVVLGGSRWTQDAAAGVQAWAEGWHLPVATDFRCQDLIDNASSVYAGVLGYGRDPRLAARLADADLIVAVGSTLGAVATEGGQLVGIPAARAGVVQVLPDPEAHGAATRPDISITASPGGFARAIAGSAPVGEPAWVDEVKVARAEYLEFRDPPPDGDRLDLVVAMRELRDRLPPDALVTFGAGGYSQWVVRILTHHTYPSQLAPRNGTMGFGVPAAVAACLEFPARRVVSVAGDGCFLMNGQEIATAMARKLAPVIVVVNNSTYGTIRRHQEAAYPGRVSGTDLVNPDFAAYARAFGAYGEAVTETAQVGPALDRAFAAGQLALIELRADPRRLAPGLTVADVRDSQGPVG